MTEWSILIFFKWLREYHFFFFFAIIVEGKVVDYFWKHLELITKFSISWRLVPLKSTSTSVSLPKFFLFLFLNNNRNMILLLWNLLLKYQFKKQFCWKEFYVFLFLKVNNNTHNIKFGFIILVCFERSTLNCLQRF